MNKYDQLGRIREFKSNQANLYATLEWQQYRPLKLMKTSIYPVDYWACGFHASTHAHSSLLLFVPLLFILRGGPVTTSI